MGLDLTVQIVLFTLLIVAAYTDMTAGKVYNWCTFPALLLGLILNYWIGGTFAGPPNLFESMVGMAMGFGFFVIFYFPGLVGGGDLKLVTAIGALKGWKFLLSALLYTSIVGAVLAVLYLIWAGSLMSGMRASLRMAFRIRRREMNEEELKETEPARKRIPYGVAIAVGTMLAFLKLH